MSKRTCKPAVLPSEIDYRIVSERSHPDTILLALSAVLRAAGRSIDYEDLAGATGLAWLFSWDSDLPCSANQALAGQTQLVVAAAPALGVQLRPILLGDGDCPPCPRLAGHFRDSFFPLAELAIAHGQPILCRGGWLDANGPDEHGDLSASQWGVVTRAMPGGVIGLAGLTVDDEQPRMLRSPPSDLLAVESVYPQSPDWDALLAASLRIARRLVVTGEHEKAGQGRQLKNVAAFRKWRDQLDLIGHSPCNAQLAERLYSRRLAGYEFLCRHGSRPAPAVGAASMQLEPLLARQIELLSGLNATGLAQPASLDELIELEEHIEQVLHEFNDSRGD